MEDEARQALRKKQMEELYAAIGEFVVEFEQLCWSMRTLVTFMMHSQGLREQQVANIVLAGYTADPLRALLESLCGQLWNLKDTEKTILRNIFKRIQKLTEDRNDFAHSTWHIGWGNVDFPDFTRHFLAWKNSLLQT